tara:strand:+ start:494571 stop:494762 length:192 start_codon:yes stop_codon:yes gene_type:complete
MPAPTDKTAGLAIDVTFYRSATRAFGAWRLGYLPAEQFDAMPFATYDKSENLLFAKVAALCVA